MVNMTFAVPEDLHKQMRKHNEIKWSAVCREAIAKKMKQLEQNETTMSRAQAIAEMDKIREKMKEKLKGWDSTAEIRKWRDSRYSS